MTQRPVTSSPVSYRLKRRNFIQGVGAAIGLHSFLGQVERAEAQGVTAPRRIVFMQRPVGTIPQNWFPQGQGTNFTMSRILTPFTPLRDKMIVFEDLKLPYEGSTGGGHERGTVI